MILAALFALVIGVLCGAFWLPDVWAMQVAQGADWVLYALMISVGISIGANREMLRRLREYRVRVLVIPLGVVIGSLLAGAAIAPLTGDSVRQGMAVTAGMGWYSLGGIMVTELLGAQAGTIAFLSNLLRELLAFVLIPMLMKKTGAYTAIAAAGATSEDTTLPVMIRYGGEEVALISVLNGMLVSAAVPTCINLVCQGF